MMSLIDRLWNEIVRMKKRLNNIEKKCSKSEEKWANRENLYHIQKELLLLRKEIQELKMHPGKIVVERLENTVGFIQVENLSGILNVGVAQNVDGGKAETPSFIDQNQGIKDGIAENDGSSKQKYKEPISR